MNKKCTLIYIITVIACLIYCGNALSQVPTWSAAKKTTSAYRKWAPNSVLESVNDKIHYVWQEDDGSGVCNIWTAQMNTDGTGWSATRRTFSDDAWIPQLVLDSVNNKIYYTWH